MNVWGQLFYLLLDAFRVYALYRFAGIFFDRGSEKTYTRLMYFSYFAIHSFCYLWPASDSIILAVNSAGLFLVVMSGYEGGDKRKILAVVLSLGIGLVSENLAWMLFMNGKPETGKNIGMFFSVFFFFILEVIIEKNVKVEKNLEVPAIQNFILISIPIGSIYIANELVRNSGRRAAAPAVSLCVLLVINVFVFYLYENVLEHYINLKDQELSMLQLKMYQNQLEIMKNANTAYRSLRHDMKHHMFMVGEYIRGHEYEKALEYLGKMNGYIGNKKRYAATGNETVDSILNYIKEEAEKIGGRTSIQAGNLEGLSIDDFDMNMILSNLLLNACEAMGKARKKMLDVRMEYDRGCLVIHIKNTYDGNLNQKNGKFFTTKEEWKNHGIGLASVKRTVEKYGGEMKIQHTQEEFLVMVLMFVPFRS